MSQVYTLGASGKAEPHLFAAVICVEKKRLYPAVKEIRRVRAHGLAMGHVDRLGWVGQVCGRRRSCIPLSEYSAGGLQQRAGAPSGVQAMRRQPPTLAPLRSLQSV